MFGKDKVQAKLLGNLEDHFLKVHRTHQLPVGDFPDVTKFRKTMEGHELTKFPKFDQKQARGTLLNFIDRVTGRQIFSILSYGRSQLRRMVLNLICVDIRSAA